MRLSERRKPLEANPQSLKEKISQLQKSQREVDERQAKQEKADAKAQRKQHRSLLSGTRLLEETTMVKQHRNATKGRDSGSMRGSDPIRLSFPKEGDSLSAPQPRANASPYTPGSNNLSRSSTTQPRGQGHPTLPPTPSNSFYSRTDDTYRTQAFETQDAATKAMFRSALQVDQPLSGTRSRHWPLSSEASTSNKTVSHPPASRKLDPKSSAGPMRNSTGISPNRVRPKPKKQEPVVINLDESSDEDGEGQSRTTSKQDTPRGLRSPEEQRDPPYNPPGPGPATHTRKGKEKAVLSVEDDSDVIMQHPDARRRQQKRKEQDLRPSGSNNDDEEPEAIEDFEDDARRARIKAPHSSPAASDVEALAPGSLDVGRVFSTHSSRKGKVANMKDRDGRVREGLSTQRGMQQSSGTICDWEGTILEMTCNDKQVEGEICQTAKFGISVAKSQVLFRLGPANSDPFCIELQHVSSIHAIRCRGLQLESLGLVLAIRNLNDIISRKFGTEGASPIGSVLRMEMLAGTQREFGRLQSLLDQIKQTDALQVRCESETVMILETALEAERRKAWKWLQGHAQNRRTIENGKTENPPRPRARPKQRADSSQNHPPFAATHSEDARRSDRLKGQSKANYSQVDSQQHTSDITPRNPPSNPDAVICMWPPIGRGEITITAGDLFRLEGDEYLNDTLIEYGLKEISSRVDGWFAEAKQQASRGEEGSDANRWICRTDDVHVFNSFFYDKLHGKKGLYPPKHKMGQGMPAEWPSYEAVRKWTSKVDIFKKKFIVVPINEHRHWYMAVIYNPAAVLNNPLKPIDLTPERRSARNKERQISPTTTEAAVEAVIDLESLEEAVPSSLSQEQRGQGLDDECGAGETSADELRLGPATPIKEDLNSREHVARVHPRADKPSGEPSTMDQPANDFGMQTDPSMRDLFDYGYIFTFDSMGGAHRAVSKRLNTWLVYEAYHRQGRYVEADFEMPLAYKEVKVPQQSNSWDCGVYLLHYAEVLLRNPGQVLPTIVRQPGRAERRADPRLIWLDKQVIGRRKEWHDKIKAMAETYKPITVPAEQASGNSSAMIEADPPGGLAISSGKDSAAVPPTESHRRDGLDVDMPESGPSAPAPSDDIVMAEMGPKEAGGSVNLGYSDMVHQTTTEAKFDVQMADHFERKMSLQPQNDLKEEVPAGATSPSTKPAHNSEPLIGDQAVSACASPSSAWNLLTQADVREDDIDPNLIVPNQTAAAEEKDRLDYVNGSEKDEPFEDGDGAPLPTTSAVDGLAAEEVGGRPTAEESIAPAAGIAQFEEEPSDTLQIDHVFEVSDDEESQELEEKPSAKLHRQNISAEPPCFQGGTEECASRFEDDKSSFDSEPVADVVEVSKIKPSASAQLHGSRHATLNALASSIVSSQSTPTSTFSCMKGAKRPRGGFSGNYGLNQSPSRYKRQRIDSSQSPEVLQDSQESYQRERTPSPQPAQACEPGKSVPVAHHEPSHPQPYLGEGQAPTQSVESGLGRPRKDLESEGTQHNPFDIVDSDGDSE